ncbi:PC20A, putative [Perkinsus marinus ATCC 50983]|uniref:PC20A, putative n=1 Tax=Perkinsus marinus (strain ATCC 50983 / TXsc) TaxID=423536 RepID=C5L7A7_PERM5|nr:PC20A, putative [Perkinsus marinus ATCC 50983]EER07369.1 PC20A, putative [Perkinsus marinus ATCC 50983]|eukprot:XP_002775553.1 PC20A, putative [Perkinsus marinus ATCC 50983]
MWKFILLLTILLPVVSPYPEDGDEATEYEKDFDGFDQDADGVIDAQEIRSVYNGDLQPQELDAFVREVDTNQDGLSERSYELMHADFSF